MQASSKKRKWEQEFAESDHGVRHTARNEEDREHEVMEIDQNVKYADVPVEEREAGIFAENWWQEFSESELSVLCADASAGKRGAASGRKRNREQDVTENCHRFLAYCCKK